MTDEYDVPLISLNDGRTIPQVGIGVYQVPPKEVERVVLDAIDVGYRHIDTATIYRNEDGVGRALSRTGIPREELFLTTKLWNEDQGYESALTAFEQSLERLQTDYVNLYLIHWPCPARESYVESWRALEAIASSGRARSIGVSNFLEPHLEKLLSHAEVVPAVNQIELHPRFQQASVVELGKSRQIATEAYSPLAQSAAHSIPEIVQIAEDLNRTPAQVILRWHTQRGTIVIPKTMRRERMLENLALFDFTLSDEQMKAITALENNGRINNDPATFN